MKIIIASLKTWNFKNYKKLKSQFPHIKFYLIAKKEDLSLNNIQKINPKYIFFHIGLSSFLIKFIKIMNV
ncbi:hypothetical protein OLO85_04580 [Campylobacter jejuni]|nr:hypothetical protein [Campylobacter jejuni]